MFAVKKYQFLIILFLSLIYFLVIYLFCIIFSKILDTLRLVFLYVHYLS